MPHPNLLFITVDQLTSRVLSLYGGRGVPTPRLDALAASGVTFDHMISTAPVCAPFRSMWLTGRWPQSTGHVVNFVDTRHDEIGWGDVFGRQGYDTGYIGKWHLHRGSFPVINGPDFVPEGRDRLGFRWWRGYNFHMDYFDGTVNREDCRFEKWKGYETEALAAYAFEFLDTARDKSKPFCLMVCPHQPHFTPHEFAPPEAYAGLDAASLAPPDVHGLSGEAWRVPYRHYLAMVRKVDAFVGELLDGLAARGLENDTLVAFTSDHGTNLGAHGLEFWGKKAPYEESIHIPLLLRLPGVFEGGKRNATLSAPVDLLPTFATLCGIRSPKCVEGSDLSDAWTGKRDSAVKPSHGNGGAPIASVASTGRAPVVEEAVLLMNIGRSHDHLEDGNDWRGVRTRTHAYARYHGGETLLFDLVNDPRERENLAGRAENRALEGALAEKLDAMLRARGDGLFPASAYANWFDAQRRVVRNAYGPLPHPETEPDWAQLG